MTFKSYLRMLFATMTILFVATSCKDEGKDETPPPSYSFSVAVSNIAQTEATVTVTPSDAQATYYYAVVQKSAFDAAGSDAAYAKKILADLQAQADKKSMSLSDYLKTALSKGSTPQKVTDLTEQTEYYAVVLGMLTDGRFTSDLVKKAFSTTATPVTPVTTLTKAGSYFFGDMFGDFDNFSLWLSESGVTESGMAFTGEGTYLVLDINASVTGNPVLPARTFSVSTTAAENTIAAGVDGGGTYTGSVIVRLKAGASAEYLYIDGGSLTIDGSETSYVVTANVTSVGKEYKFKFEGAIPVLDVTGGGGEEGPELSVTMRAGDGKGENKATAVSATVQSTTATSAKYWLSQTAVVDQKLAAGDTYETLADQGNSFPAEWITILTSEKGATLPYNNCLPEESWTMIVKVTDANGNSTVKHASATTESAGVASDAYKAWLGTWTVTSASSEGTKTPIIFEVTFKQKVANATYVAEGWTTAMWYDDPVKYASMFAEAKFDAEKGRCYFENGQLLGPIDDKNGTGEYLFNLRYLGTDGKTYVNKTKLIALVGTLDSGKTTAQVVGSDLVNDKDVKLGTVTSMSHYYWYYTGAEKDNIYGTKPGAPFVNGNDINYPVGPYALVKKGAAAVSSSVAPAPSMHAIRDGRALYAGNLSSVLPAIRVAMADLQAPVGTVRIREAQVNRGTVIQKSLNVETGKKMKK